MCSLSPTFFARLANRLVGDFSILTHRRCLAIEADWVCYPVKDLALSLGFLRKYFFEFGEKVLWIRELLRCKSTSLTDLFLTFYFTTFYHIYSNIPSLGHTSSMVPYRHVRAPKLYIRQKDLLICSVPRDSVVFFFAPVFFSLYRSLVLIKQLRT